MAHPVTWGFLALCFAATVPCLVAPGLYDWLGGVAPRTHPWQPVTAVFVHGWPGFPGAVHLALNTFLILETGRPCERLLGSARFLGLGAAALAANAIAVALTDGVNGSSLVIWAWGPPLFLALRAPVPPHRTRTLEPHRVRGMLVLLYGILPVVMTLLPYAFGFHGNPARAFLMGNLFHLVATGVGIAFTVAAARFIRSRASRPVPGAPHRETPVV